jgi:hypothetical protein
MLAYLFWHWPRDGHTYEADLIAFHRALRDHRPEGLLDHASYWVESLPWLSVRSIYEDWYLLDGFAGLDTLNHAAVAPPLTDAHERVARANADGAGGLYALKQGTPALDTPVASWLRKPGGMPYDRFLGGLPPDLCLFQRQLVLGPGLEFCALGPLPGATIVRRRRLC